MRRLEVIQESFAKYAYFTDFDYSTGIVFGGGDVILGPAHSNDDIRIHFQMWGVDDDQGHKLVDMWKRR